MVVRSSVRHERVGLHNTGFRVVCSLATTLYEFLRFLESPALVRRPRKHACLVGVAPAAAPTCVRTCPSASDGILLGRLDSELDPTRADNPEPPVRLLFKTSLLPSVTNARSSRIVRYAPCSSSRFESHASSCSGVPSRGDHGAGAASRSTPVWDLLLGL